jgi:hypothetical protein
MTSFSRSSNVIPLRRTSSTSDPSNQKHEKRVAERRRKNRRVPGSDAGQGAGANEHGYVLRYFRLWIAPVFPRSSRF